MKTAMHVLAAAMMVAAAAPAEAGVIVGGSDLLTPGYLIQLETWLGEGQLTLTNIFDKSQGSTAADFHAAADGKGRTFTVMRATDDGVTRIVGGYNPQSWNSSGSYNLTLPDAARTAFLFNLEDGIKRAQRLSSELVLGGDGGWFQTFNGSNYGPTFGSGHDLWIDGNLTVSYNYGWTYGTDAENARSIISGLGYNGANMQVAELEVFTIAASAPAQIPEPATLALLGGSALILGAFRWRKVRANSPGRRRAKALVRFYSRVAWSW